MQILDPVTRSRTRCLLIRRLLIISDSYALQDQNCGNKRIQVLRVSDPAGCAWLAALSSLTLCVLCVVRTRTKSFIIYFESDSRSRRKASINLACRRPRTRWSHLIDALSLIDPSKQTGIISNRQVNTNISRGKYTKVRLHCSHFMFWEKAVKNRSIWFNVYHRML